MANLAVPKKRSTRHARTVTRFCDEANIANDDQLDLAEFIVAAHYLGAGVDDGKLMEIFAKMEDEIANDGKAPKDVIKELMKQVEEEYGMDDIKNAADDAKADELKDDTEHEIVGKTLKDAVTAEDAQWQEIQIDGFLSAAAQHQNIQIAKKLMQDTALTKEDVAQITGVDPKLLAEYEDEEESDEDYDEDDDEDDDNNEAKNDKVTDAATISLAAANKPENAEAVVIKSTEFGKSIALTTGDLNKLDELITGGASEIGKNEEAVISLLKKLQQAVKLSPGGAKTLKAQRTMRRLDHQQSSVQVNDEDEQADTESKKKGADHTKTKSLQAPKLQNTSSEYRLNDDYELAGVKLPSKFRVVITPGALVKTSIDIRSSEVAKVPIGTVVIVEHVDGRRARISSPVGGWVSLHAKDGRTILQKENTSSKEMENAVHAQRARQTKILILKSITTLNDATVTRILEKSDWNLRRAIEAFYMAKYKTQQFMEKKQRAAKEAEAKTQATEAKSTDAPAKDDGKKASGGAAAAAPKDEDIKTRKPRRSIAGWWSSWKTFSHANK